MTSIPGFARAAMEHARRGDFEQALAAARRAIESNPQDVGVRVFTAMLHIRRNELAEALPHLKAAFALNAAEPFLTFELVRVLIGLGELDEAEATLDQVHLSGTEPIRLRAMLLDRRGKPAEAADLYRQVVATDAQDFETWGNLGFCLLATGRLHEAIAAFGRSLAIRPDRMSVRHKWSEAHFTAGTGEQALAELKEQARRNPSDANACVAVAHLENLLGRPDDSLASLGQALKRDGSNTEALVAFAEAMEHRNDLARLEEALSRLTALDVSGGKVPLLRARLAYRRGEYERALDLARSSSPALDPATRSQVIGQSLDRLGEPESAFQAFAEMNREDARTGIFTERTAEEARASLAEERKLLSAKWVGSWQADAAPASRLPAFLVGFPRSGTTLLDTFLMGHGDAAVAEEEPMLAIVKQRVGGLSRLPGVDAGEAERLRNLYFEEAEKHAPEARERLLVDKNPFAMNDAPLIARIFPAAPIIFMERHPCDVVLSCFMTRFQPTGFGANFLTLEDTALLYDEMMQLWTRSTAVIELNRHPVRYERLIDDPEGELRPVARFLGLDWLPKLLNHRETARRRAFIKTPSYAQVTEPVSKAPIGRWLRYRKQLEPVLPMLEPWAKRMGYEV